MSLDTSTCLRVNPVMLNRIIPVEGQVAWQLGGTPPEEVEDSLRENLKLSTQHPVEGNWIISECYQTNWQWLLLKEGVYPPPTLEELRTIARLENRSGAHVYAINILKPGISPLDAAYYLDNRLYATGSPDKLMERWARDMGCPESLIPYLDFQKIRRQIINSGSYWVDCRDYHFSLVKLGPAKFGQPPEQKTTRRAKYAPRWKDENPWLT